MAEAADRGGRVAIYALCAADGIVRYVGKARDPERRLSQHRKGRSGNVRFNEWMLSFGSAGIGPTLRVLEWCADGEWKQREKHWISHYAGALLLNISPGGNEPVVPRKDAGKQRRLWEIKQRLGLALKRGELSDAVKAKMRLAAETAPHLFGAWAKI